MMRIIAHPLRLTAGLLGAWCGVWLLAVITAGNTVAEAAASPIQCNSLTAAAAAQNGYAFTAAAAGSNSAITGYTFDFGDHQMYTVTFSKHAQQDHHSATVTHSYQTAGVYAASVRVNIKQNGQKTTVSSPNCQLSLAVGPSDSTLPNTGNSGALLVFAGTTLLATAGYWLHLRYRLTHPRK